MSFDSVPILAVPTNIITGFLGVGKTTAILKLLESKPANERWAVLVNEFGEIGVDGSLLQGHNNEPKHVFIREVPGGCMCCAAGLPMQIAIADTVVGNKLDLYVDADKSRLEEYVDGIGALNAKLIFAKHGTINIAELEGETNAKQRPHHHHHRRKPLASELPMPESGIVRATNNEEGFESIGWRFAPDKHFDRQRLHHFLIELKVERIKAVFITPDGVFGFNLTEDGLTEVKLDDCVESRIEIISDSINSVIEHKLLECLVS
ncbi:GTP-binding protein [Vibrio sp. DW001]|uniref:CobW family GTP-binding protein n=1 Tax=Vibrio sp. DW001 TaxID=2912315 RepID=UPI0023AF4C0A|nr:GTP-binding protein [Vibrio sp. DW001]WED25764.1 GTP-binding protein [Vibrio sp. DW001]